MRQAFIISVEMLFTGMGNFGPGGPLSYRV